MQLVELQLYCLSIQLAAFPFFAPSLDLSRPSEKNLVLIKYTDHQGKLQRYRLTREVSSKWQDIGTLLDLRGDDLLNYQQHPPNNVQSSTLVFGYWFANFGEHPEYPVEWSGLCELLCDVEKTEVARKLKEVLACARVEVDWESD